MEDKFSSYILNPLIQNICTHASRPALHINGTTYTYEQLGNCISAIRCLLRQQGGTDRIAALAVHDDIETYASIFSLWMEGMAYVPLHPNQPLERNNSIISQVGTQLILDSAVNSPFNAVNTSMVKANNSQDWFGDIVQVDIDQLAYILFTSGSTGVPK